MDTKEKIPHTKTTIGVQEINWLTDVDGTVPVVIGDSVGTTDYFRLKRGAVLLKDMVTEIGALGRLLTLDS